MSRKKDIVKLKQAFGKVKDEDFNFELIERYFRKKNHTESFQVISDKTCQDLDFDEVFMFLDRTHSRVGQQYLYDQLRTLSPSDEHVALRERLIQRFSEDPQFRIEIQRYLMKLNKDDVFYINSLFQEEHAKPPKWFFLIRVMAFASLISIILFLFNKNMFLVVIGIFLINIGFHYWNKKNLHLYLGSIPQLLKLSSIAQKLWNTEALREIDPHIEQAFKVMKQVRNKMSFFRLEASLQSEAQVLFWTLLELVKTIFLLEPLFLFGVLRQLDKRRQEVEQIFRFVGEIDLILSVSSLRSGQVKVCCPVFIKKGIDAHQMFHPLIPRCVPNELKVHDRSILLTGSNMSGKTTFIRTLGINMITGQTIHTCFADRMEMQKMRIYSAIRISDDLLNDRSYYFEEVLTIRNLLEKSEESESSLFLMDEIFKGTNTIERIAAGKAVLSRLSQNGNIVLVSTHDIELTEWLDGEYDLFHFSERVEDQSIDFDFLIKEGKLTNRNAIRILQINGYPADLVEEAFNISENLDQTQADHTN